MTYRAIKRVLLLYSLVAEPGCVFLWSLLLVMSQLMLILCSCSSDHELTDHLHLV
jgi:hypothetical protein